MLSSKIKDLRDRNIFCKLEKSRVADKFLFFNLLNKSQSNTRKMYSLAFFQDVKNKNYSRTKIVRRCVLTNRNRGVLRPFGISRIYLREMMQFGLVPGYSKAVW